MGEPKKPGEQQVTQVPNSRFSLCAPQSLLVAPGIDGGIQQVISTCQRSQAPMLNHCPLEWQQGRDPCSTPHDDLSASLPEMPAECHWMCVSSVGPHRRQRTNSGYF